MIKLYTIDCPLCLILEEKLSSKGVEFETIKDKELLLQLGLNDFPILEVDGEKLDYESAIHWVNSR